MLYWSCNKASNRSVNSVICSDHHRWSFLICGRQCSPQILMWLFMLAVVDHPVAVSWNVYNYSNSRGRTRNMTACSNSYNVQVKGTKFAPISFLLQCFMRTSLRMLIWADAGSFMKRKPGKWIRSRRNTGTYLIPSALRQCLVLRLEF